MSLACALIGRGPPLVHAATNASVAIDGTSSAAPSTGTAPSRARRVARRPHSAWDGHCAGDRRLGIVYGRQRSPGEPARLNHDAVPRGSRAAAPSSIKSWEFRNHALTQASDPELAVADIERPKIIYNSATGKFVMWTHKENGRNYEEARAAVAVSDTVDGNYTWRGSFRAPGNEMSRDMTLFKDDDGTAYQVSAARDNADLRIYKLTADYTAYDKQVADPGTASTVRRRPCSSGTASISC
jgi:hypothetical protein